MSRDLTIVHIASVTLRTAYTMWMSRDPVTICAVSIVHFLVLPSKRICPLLCALPVLFHHLDLKQMVPSPVIDLVEWDRPCSFHPLQILNTPKIKTYHLCMWKFCKNPVVVFPIDTFQVFSTKTHWFEISDWIERFDHVNREPGPGSVLYVTVQ